MKLIFETFRCIGREVPFGHTYDHPECKSCARMQATLPNRLTVWSGPIKFDNTCIFKIRSETE